MTYKKIALGTLTLGLLFGLWWFLPLASPAVQASAPERQATSGATSELITDTVDVTMTATVAPTATPTALPTKTPTPLAIPFSDGVITFEHLGENDDSLKGPYDSSRVSFYLPAHWQLLEGSALHLDVEVLGGKVASSGLTSTLSGDVEVALNSEVLGRISLSTLGRRTEILPLPTASLTSTRADGRYELTFFLSSGGDCDLAELQPELKIYNTSLFAFKYDVISPPTDLTRLPWPIQQRSVEPDRALIIMPDQATREEVQAALIAAAGLGRLTGGDIQIGFRTESELSSAERSAVHLIYVGLPGTLADLQALTDLPIMPVFGGQIVALPGPLPEDGVIQMVVSPWNPARMALWLGGSTGEGVVKAAQAFSASPLQAGVLPNLSVVANVQPQIPVSPSIEQQLSDMGYTDVTFQRIGTSSTEYRFYVPPGMSFSADAYFDISFSYSGVLDYQVSNLTASLNGTPFGSVQFSQNSVSVQRVKLNIPPTLIRSGANRLVVRAGLFPISRCANPLIADVWATIHADSLLRLPLTPMVTQRLDRLNLGDYPEFLTTDPQLSNIAFMFPPNDVVAWKAAMQVAFYLGDQSDARLADLVLITEPSMPEDLRATRDLIVVGRPAELPILTELGAALPAPFDLSTNLALETTSLVSYRLPPGTSVGYLELLTAPWNAKQLILTVLGSNDEGLLWAANALTNTALIARLAGNFAVINGEHVYATDTLLKGPTGSIVPTAIAGGQTDAPEIAPPPSAQREAWILPALGAGTGAMVLVIVIAAVMAWRERHAAQSDS